MMDTHTEDTSDYCLTRMLVPWFTPKSLGELRSRLEEIKGSQKPHILTGVIGQPFSLGGDLGHFLGCIGSGDFRELYAYAEDCAKLVVSHYNMPQLTISYLKGDAFGGGLEAALTSDVRLAEPGVKMAFPEARFGSFPGMGGYRLLSRLTTPVFAMDAIITGSTIRDTSSLASVVDNEEQVISKLQYYTSGRVAQLKLFKRANPLCLRDLKDSIYEWTYVMMNLTPTQLGMIRRIYQLQRSNIHV